jgi:hypothetical protein
VPYFGRSTWRSIRGSSRYGIRRERGEPIGRLSRASCRAILCRHARRWDWMSESDRRRSGDMVRRCFCALGAPGAGLMAASGGGQNNDSLRWPSQHVRPWFFRTPQPRGRVGSGTNLNLERWRFGEQQNRTHLECLVVGGYPRIRVTMSWRE